MLSGAGQESVFAYTFRLYAELFHHFQSHLDIGHSVGAFYTGGKIAAAEAGDNKQGAQKLAAAVDIDTDCIFPEAMCFQGKREMSLCAFRAVYHFAAQFLQGI